MASLDKKVCRKCGQDETVVKFYDGKKDCSDCCKRNRRDRYRDGKTAVVESSTATSLVKQVGKSAEKPRRSLKGLEPEGFMDVVNAVTILLKIDRRLRPQDYDEPQAEC